VSLEGFNYFKPGVLYVDVEKNDKLNLLQKSLQQFFKDTNIFLIKADDRPFHPHVTIATRDLYKKAFYEAWEIFKTKKYKASWMVAGISLLRHNQKNWDVIFTSQFKN
jgi:2'-5' RNA ligase